MKMKGDDMKMNAASPIDTLVIERVVGMKGKFNNGDYKITVPQNDLSVAAFQWTPDHAAVAWDFTMTENEVAP